MPVVAIVLQGVWAAVIALTGKYDQILNYVVAIDVLFFGLTGASLLIFRARERKRRSRPRPDDRMRVPGHPVTTIVFVAACWAVSAVTVINRPQSAGIGVGILLLGVDRVSVLAKADGRATTEAGRELAACVSRMVAMRLVRCALVRRLRGGRLREG